MSANSGSLIIVCAVASAVILIVSFLHERLKAFNAKHSIITYCYVLISISRIGHCILTK